MKGEQKRNRDVAEKMDVILLALKMEGRDHEPRNEVSLEKLEKVRKHFSSESGRAVVTHFQPLTSRS